MTRGLVVHPSDGQRGDCTRCRHDRAAPVLGTDAGVGRDAAKACLEPEVAGRALDHLPDRGGVVEDKAEGTAQAAHVEHARAGQRALLPDGEQQLELRRRALFPEPAGERQQHHDGGLVVGSEDPLVGVLPHALGEPGLHRRLQGDRVEVGAEHHPPGIRRRRPTGPLPARRSRPAGGRGGCRNAERSSLAALSACDLLFGGALISNREPFQCWCLPPSPRPSPPGEGE